RDHHLTPTGGPWGGIGGHKEVFNARGHFAVDGMVETCSTMTWLKLSTLLYGITQDRMYIDAVHQSLHNALLGAADPNGRDW
ncbi:beta-L-arabinofuranosidase domain-containing protein, partial [Acinetobacter baumannii]